MKGDNENMDNMMPSGYYNSPRRQAATAFASQNGYIPNGTPINGPGFSFRKRYERVDWRKMAAVDVDRVSRDLDFTVLQDNIMNLTFCNIEQELDTRMIDPNFLKLFKLAQLTIEYLLHSQEYLANTISVLEDKLHNAMQEHEATKITFSKQTEEMKNLKKENRKRKKMLEAQQSLIHAGANNYHKCQYCQKAFINGSFLQAHMQRRHPEFVLPSATLQLQNQAAKANEKLEKEIEELRQNLKHAQSQMNDQKKNFQEQLAAKEQNRKDEKQKMEMEKWKQEQLEIQKKEMEALRETFMKELKEIQDKYSISQRQFEDLQAQYGQKSNLGNLVDDVDLQKQREEYDKTIKDMSEQMRSLKESMRKDMHGQLKDQEKRWKDRMKELKMNHENELEILNENLEQTKMQLGIEKEGGSNVGKSYEKQLKELMRRSKEQDKVIKAQEKQLRDLHSKAAFAAVITSTPIHPKKCSCTETKPPISPPPLITTTEPSSDEEKQPLDPRRIAKLREELKHTLEQYLERRGIARACKGISTTTFHNKATELEQERQQLALKHKTFQEVREQCRKELNHRTKEKLREAQKSPSASTAKKNVAKKEKASNLLSVGRNSKTPDRSPRRKKQPPRAIASTSPPPVAPRSPDKIGAMSTMSTTGSWDTTTYTRGTYGDDTDSEEESEEEEEEEEEEEVEEEETEEDAESESNWDSEEESELKHLKSSTEVSTKQTSAVRQPRGALVRDMTKSIERQLSGRGGQKPVGGVDLSGSVHRQQGRDQSDGSPTPRIPSMGDEEDSDFSISSLEDLGSAAAPKPVAASSRRQQPAPAPRHRTSSETESSNTYGTSFWGSASHKGPGPSKEAGSGHGTGKSSVSVTDWDDDLDIDELT
uniref:Zinc finger protein Dzip1-like n=1 Tax=Saccoglossus kowalevskii TaxID=10224 RepID=A0ABM0MTF1_SACKO|nr:PREDICTED: zinc finger protein Dzip1-like [Saccoglossus kowalevskii]